MEPTSADRDGERPARHRNVLGRIWNATRYSMQGLAAAYRHEAAFRQEVLMAAVLVPLACWLDVSAAERALMIAAVLLVLVVELLNSAIEAVVDRISFENHPLAKRAKDLGSAAVCVSLVGLGAVWIAILLG
jgi:diacylglycerol kinase (ATP)